jgi:hypothetical protein
MTRLAPLLCLVLLHIASASDAAQAIDPRCTGSYDQRLGMRYARDAYRAPDGSALKSKDGGSLVGPLVCIHDGELVKSRAETATQALANASPDALRSAAADLIQTQLNELPRRTSGGDGQFAAVVAKLQQEMSAAALEVRSLRDLIKITDPEYPHLVVSRWTVDSNAIDEAHGLPAEYLSSHMCLNIAEITEACDAAYSDAIRIADEVYLVGVVVSFLNKSARQSFGEEAGHRVNRWNQYLDTGLSSEAQFSYWWELAANHYIETKCPVWFRWECSKSKLDPHGNEIGFREVPSAKLIALHPDIGVQYIEHEPNGERVKPTLLMQWVGLQWWTWDKDTISDLKGISFVSTISDTSKSNRVGFGIGLQYRRYSLAVTAHGGAVALTINTALVDRLGTVNQKWAQTLKAPLQN